MFNDKNSKKSQATSPFYLAVNSQKIWCIEMFCDYGADMDSVNHALLHSAIHGYDDMCMYLSLRCEDLNVEDDDGKTAFVIYLLRKDLDRI